MNFKYKAIGFVTMILIMIISISFIITNKTCSMVSGKIDKFIPTVVIDAGHGGFDGGAETEDNIIEKDINLNIALKLKDLFTSNGFKVNMTREKDIALCDESEANNKKKSDLSKRVQIFNSNKNNIVISIHQNMFCDSRYFGTQVFYSANDPKSESLAECIKNSTTSLIQPDNTRKCKKAGSEIFILNKSTVPTVLIECGFLSNELEAKKLKDEEYQKKLAYCIFLGFLEYYYTNY